MPSLPSVLVQFYVYVWLGYGAHSLVCVRYFVDVDNHLALKEMTLNHMGGLQSVEGLKCRGFPGKKEFFLNTVLEIPSEFPACWPTLQISDLPAPTIV